MKKFLWGIVFLSFFYFSFSCFQACSSSGGFPLKVYFLDVGQGDAILIDYLNGYQVLIDSGPSGDKLLWQLGKHMPLGDKKIEVAVLTHPDKDHLAGFLPMLENFQVELFLTNGQRPDSQNFLALEDKLKEKGVKTEAVYEGSSWRIGQDLEFLVYNPDEDNSENKQEKNDQSVILEMEYGENRFFFAADAEKETERDMLADGELQSVDWLKVAHHGSKNASTEDFLSVVRPQSAIISVGKNSYGHPTEEVLERLGKAGAEVFRTDQQGTVGVFCSKPEGKCQTQFFSSH